MKKNKNNSKTKQKPNNKKKMGNKIENKKK